MATARAVREVSRSARAQINDAKSLFVHVPPIIPTDRSRANCHTLGK